MDSEVRFRPQAKLAEIGTVGMAKIRASQFTVYEQAGAWVEVAYLERAGAEVKLVSQPLPETHVARGSHDAQTVVFRHAEAFRFAASCEIAAGSWRALRQLRTVLGITG